MAARTRSRATERAARSQAGYMLIEMVAALALTGLLMAFVFPRAPNGTSAAQFSGVVTASAALLRDARSAAIAQAAPLSARFDARARRLRMGAQEVTIPGDVDVSMEAGGNCPSDGSGVARIVFRADGTNCGGVFRFARAGRVMRVRVDWVDGRIDVVQGG